MMMRLLIWLVIGFAVVTWIRRTLAAGRPAARPGMPPNRHAAPGARREHVESMLQCAHCGVHFPASEALPGDGDTVYCCAEHKALGRR